MNAMKLVYPSPFQEKCKQLLKDKLSPEQYELLQKTNAAKPNWSRHMLPEDRTTREDTSRSWLYDDDRQEMYKEDAVVNRAKANTAQRKFMFGKKGAI